MKIRILLIVLLAFQNGVCQSIARIAIGNTYYAAKIKQYDSEAAQNGITLALFFPLRFSAVDAHLKMGVSRHTGWATWGFGDSFRINKMYSCTNEILIGKG